MAPTGETFRIVSDLSQYRHRDGLPLGTRGGISATYNFPRNGEYDIELKMLDLFAGAAIREPHQLELSIDGEQVAVFDLAPADAKGDPRCRLPKGPRRAPHPRLR